MRPLQINPLASRALTAARQHVPQELAPRARLRALLDPETPGVLEAFTRLDQLRRPDLPRIATVRPLAPQRRHRVAVVVPLYNYAQYVPEAVHSAVTQEGVDVQVVIVDDCSTDDSWQVAQRLADELPGVLALRNEHNSGPGVTFNRGWQAVESDFVTRLDPDDLLVPGALARAVAVAEAVPTVGLVYGRFREFSGEPPTPHVGNPWGVVWPGREWLRRELQDDRNLIATPEALVRTSLMREHGGWKPELRHTQDHEMWLRAATVSDVGHVMDADQALKRSHAESLSTVEGMVGTTNFDEHLASYEAWFGDVGRTLPDGEELLGLGRRALARRAMRTALHAYRRADWDAQAADQLADMAVRLDPSVAGRRELAVLRAARQRLGHRVALLPTSIAGAGWHRVRETVVLGRFRNTGL